MILNIETESQAAEIPRHFKDDHYDDHYKVDSIP